MTTTETIAPHGGTLVNLLAEGAEAQALARRAENLPKIVVNPRELPDSVELLSRAEDVLAGEEVTVVHRTWGQPLTAA